VAGLLAPVADTISRDVGRAVSADMTQLSTVVALLSGGAITAQMAESAA